MNDAPASLPSAPPDVGQSQPGASKPPRRGFGLVVGMLVVSLLLAGLFAALYFTAKSDVSDAEAARDQQAAAAADLDQRVAALESDVAAADEQLAERDQSIDDARAQVDSAQAELDRTAADLAAAEAARSEAEAEVEVLQGDLDAALEELSGADNGILDNPFANDGLLQAEEFPFVETWLNPPGSQDPVTLEEAQQLAIEVCATESLAEFVTMAEEFAAAHAIDIEDAGAALGALGGLACLNHLNDILA